MTAFWPRQAPLTLILFAGLSACGGGSNLATTQPTPDSKGVVHIATDGNYDVTADLGRCTMIVFGNPASGQFVDLEYSSGRVHLYPGDWQVVGYHDDAAHHTRGVCSIPRVSLRLEQGPSASALRPTRILRS